MRRSDSASRCSMGWPAGSTIAEGESGDHALDGGARDAERVKAGGRDGDEPARAAAPDGLRVGSAGGEKTLVGEPPEGGVDRPDRPRATGAVFDLAGDGDAVCVAVQTVGGGEDEELEIAEEFVGHGYMFVFSDQIIKAARGRPGPAANRQGSVTANCRQRVDATRSTRRNVRAGQGRHDEKADSREVDDGVEPRHP